MTSQRVDRGEIHDELERARAEFHRLLTTASPGDLRRRTHGTRWTNGQLLFHMTFGYMIVLTLLPLVRTMGRLPDGASRLFASALDGCRRPFHAVNYLGSCGGALAFRGDRLAAKLDRTIDALHRRLDGETDAALDGAMHFPVSWDPYFTDVMTLRAVYHYGTQHFEHHRRQLTIDEGPGR